MLNHLTFLDITPTPNDVNKIDELRKAVLMLSMLTDKILPEAAEKSIAFRKLEEYLMYAVKTLHLNPVNPTLSSVNMTPAGGLASVPFVERATHNKHFSELKTQSEAYISERLHTLKQDVENIFNSATQTQQKKTY